MAAAVLEIVPSEKQLWYLNKYFNIGDMKEIKRRLEDNEELKEEERIYS
jgi:hypothetical protein